MTDRESGSCMKPFLNMILQIFLRARPFPVQVLFEISHLGTHNQSNQVEDEYSFCCHLSLVTKFGGKSEGVHLPPKKKNVIL